MPKSTPLPPGLKPTYEELKQTGKYREVFGKFVWSLPMRNWNRVWGQRRKLVCTFEAYLWGIETSTLPTSRPWPAVWSLPMRNWNAAILPPLVPMRKCLKPTYEELKLELDKKKLTAFMFEAYLWGIETRAWPTNSAKPYVWSLPMRNWNAVGNGFVRHRAGVWSLPMRNWNTTFTRSSPFRAYVWSLPMRNWNTAKNEALQKKLDVWSLPMRNWNWLRWIPGYSLFLVWSLPMRNWNL